MRVNVVSCLSDNYAYLLSADDRSDALVVDPSEAAPVLRACSEAGVTLVAILNTHHHWDHVGGNDSLLHQYPELRVFGHESDRDRIPGFTDGVHDGGVVRLAGIELEVLHVPGHTRGAVTYVGHGAAFTGDTLFAGGCGRLFEGTAAELFASLTEKLARLAPDTRVFCGHEYTAKNLDFASRFEPSNPALRERIASLAALRTNQHSTMPSSVAVELATNPFLRVHSDEIRARLRLSSRDSPVEVFAALRAARDRF